MKTIRINKNNWIAAFLAGVCAAASAPAGAASDVLLNLLSILRDKGSISQDEYNALVAASQGEDADAKAAADKAAADAKTVADASSWASKIKMTGDMRLRYQYEDKDGAAFDRDRGRLRYRLGIIAKPLDNVEVGAGLASGFGNNTVLTKDPVTGAVTNVSVFTGGDPRSTNQTFDSAFSGKGVRLDYAYIQYKFTDWLTAIGGKFKYPSYLYKATDMMWDDDLNPEGASVAMNFPNAWGKAFVNSGLWMIDESSSAPDDPFIGYAQAGQNFSSGDLFATAAATFYGFSNFNPANFANFQKGGGKDLTSAAGNTDFNFDVLEFAGEIGNKNLFGNGVSASIFGNYVNNTGTSTPQDEGFSLGAQVTNGVWKLKYIYADLDANAVPDWLPDSDRFGGNTNMKGHEVIAEYAVFKNLTLGLDYYNTEDKTSGVNQDIVQADVLVKF